MELIFADDRQLQALRDAHGETWEVWMVPNFMGPTGWCARHWGARSSEHVAWSAEDLDEWIRSQP